MADRPAFRIRHRDWQPDLAIECETADEAYAVIAALRRSEDCSPKRSPEEVAREVMRDLMGETYV